MQRQSVSKAIILTGERSSSVRPLRVYSESFKVKEVILGKLRIIGSARQHYGIRTKSAILE